MSDSLQPHELQHTRQPAFHYLLEFVQNHVSWVSDAIQPSHLVTTLPYMHTSRLLSTFISYHQVLFVCALVAQSCPTLCDPMDHSPWGSSVHGFPGKNIGVGCHFLLQRLSPIQELNPHVLHYRQTLYSLSHQGNSKVLFIFNWISLVKYRKAWHVAVNGVTKSGTQLKTAEISLKYVLLSSSLSWS